jgi:hypothetical protein
MEQALAIDSKFDWPYYYIGLCQERSRTEEQSGDEDAIITYASCRPGDAANQAKDRLERLYKAAQQHDGGSRKIRRPKISV